MALAHSAAVTHRTAEASGCPHGTALLTGRPQACIAERGSSLGLHHWAGGPGGRRQGCLLFEIRKQCQEIFLILWAYPHCSHACIAHGDVLSSGVGSSEITAVARGTPGGEHFDVLSAQGDAQGRHLPLPPSPLLSCLPDMSSNRVGNGRKALLACPPAIGGVDARHSHGCGAEVVLRSSPLMWGRCGQSFSTW